MKQISAYLRVICTLCLVLISVSTAYADASFAQITLPVHQRFVTRSGTAVPADPTGIYELSAEQSHTPMPEGSQHGCFRFSLQGTEAEVQIPLTYSCAGTYRYALRQVTEPSQSYEYDSACYTIVVFVQNETAGQLSTQIIVQQAEGQKCDEILFLNSYQGGGDIIVPIPETGDESQFTFWLFLFAVSLILLLFRSPWRKNSFSKL